MKQILLLITVSSLIICCSRKKADKRHNEITRVVFATGGCFGPCPYQIIDLDSSLKFKYHGVRYSDTLGFYAGTIEKNLWDSLNIRFEDINYKKLDTVYNYSMDDMATEIFIYYGKNKIKHINAQSASLPDSVKNVYDWLMKVIKNLKFENRIDSVVFPTQIQTPLPVPPLPENLKFKPPKLNGE